MKNIAVLTSGGDAPGMNACIRSVVRTAVYNKLNVFGIIEGFQGMIEGDIKPLQSSDVSGIIQKGGTVLKSSRSEDFRKEDGRKKAYNELQKHNIEGIITIGGDGTFAGANQFNKEFDIPFIGIPGTIDNDLYGTDYTIGYDTALNTVIQAVDKIRDTASSHNRLFFIEVMGKDAGFIALRSGIGVGAEAILIPESETYVNELIIKLKQQQLNHKQSMIVIVAEGDSSGGAFGVAEEVKKQFDYDTRVTVLGHVQRGGSPTAMDRVLASRLGNAAVEALIKGRKNEMVGVINNELHFTAFEEAIKHHQKVNVDLMKLAEVLAT